MSVSELGYGNHVGPMLCGLMFVSLLIACSPPPGRLDYQCIDENNKPTTYWPNVPREVVRMKSDSEWIIRPEYAGRIIRFHYYTENGEFYNAVVRYGEVCYPVQRAEAGSPGQTG